MQFILRKTLLYLSIGAYFNLFVSTFKVIKLSNYLGINCKCFSNSNGKPSRRNQRKSRMVSKFQVESDRYVKYQTNLIYTATFEKVIYQWVVGSVFLWRIQK